MTPLSQMSPRRFLILFAVPTLLFAGCSRRELQGSVMLAGNWQGVIDGTKEAVSLSFFVGGGGRGHSTAADDPFDFAWERAGNTVRLTADFPSLGTRRYLGQISGDESLVMRLVDDPSNRVLVLRRAGNNEFNRSLFENYFVK